MSQFEITLLAGFNLLDGLRKLGRKGNRDQDHSATSDRGAAQGVVGLVPGELRRTSCLGLGNRQFGFQKHPRGGRIETRIGTAILHGESESALQRQFVVLEFIDHGRKAVSGKAALHVGGGGNRERLGAGVLRRVICQERDHGMGVGANLFHGSREPALDGAVHQSVGEEIHHDQGNGR